MLDFMLEAIKEAKRALKNDEVPIGAVIVIDENIVARGKNARETSQNALHHAEIIAINKACKKLKSWRLENATLYVTLEPCPMCAGAIANARIKKVVYGCKEKSGKDNLCQQILSSTRLNHKVDVVYDARYNDEISNLLTSFFSKKRVKEV